MTLLPRNRNYNALDPFTSDVDDFFDNFLRPMRSWVDNKPGLLMPSVDIKENDNAFIVKADLPGIKKEDINVSLHEGVLTIKAESKYEDEEEKEGTVIRRERRVGQYLRRFALGPNVNESDVSAEFKDGVLQLNIPKQEPEKAQPQSIKIH